MSLKSNHSVIVTDNTWTPKGVRNFKLSLIDFDSELIPCTATITINKMDKTNNNFMYISSQIVNVLENTKEKYGSYPMFLELEVPYLHERFVDQVSSLCSLLKVSLWVSIKYPDVEYKEKTGLTRIHIHDILTDSAWNTVLAIRASKAK